MFWKKKTENAEAEAARLSGPRNVPGVVQHYLVSQMKVDPEFTPLFKAVTRHNGEDSDIRIFDESDMMARGIEVKSYATFDGKPELIIFEGHYDEGKKKVELVEKNKLTWDTRLYTVEEMQKSIEAMTQPGSTVFFYQGRGAQSGGPLSKGCCVIELNPAYPGKRQKKYNIYTANVVDMQPVAERQKLWDSDKAKDIAKWIIEGHHKRLYS